MLFQYLLNSIIRKGSLRLITADGRIRVIGDETPPCVTIKLHRRLLEWTLGLDPELKVGEAYMDGSLTIQQGDIRDFLKLVFVNFDHTGVGPVLTMLEKLNGRFRWFRQFNDTVRARLNVASHYDLPDELYKFFLDPDRQYSCGYFTNPRNSLEQAQLDKKRHLASKLFLNRPGLRVLDIGSGWGGLGLYLARESGCRVTGVTLSVEQYKRSRTRAAEAGLDKTCLFKLQDYRKETGIYDRVVSVGMFEHVGKKNYDEYFANIRRLLADDGVCLVHAVGRFNDPGPVNSFIRKHIFPGTDVSVLSEVLEPIERSGLLVTDIEILRLHYAETLKQWLDRFRLHKDEVVEHYGPNFYRKWEFYLISCEMGFRYEALMVFQIQLTKRREATPITRDYMFNWEQSHRQNARQTAVDA